MANEIITVSNDTIEDLFSKVSGLIEQARSYVKTSVNTAEVYTKYYIGKYIVDYEQIRKCPCAIWKASFKRIVS